jgi:predicted phage tail protein
MKTIMLYGFLGQEFGRVHQYDVCSPAEAIRALCTTLKGFKQSLNDGGAYRLLLGGKEALDAEQSVYPSSDKETIRIVPVVVGSKSLGKFLLGGALIGASFAFPGAGGFNLFGSSFSLAGIAGNIGFSLVLGGVSELLFKPEKAPEPAEKPESKPSFLFSGAVNTVTQGNPVPLGYGRMVVGSQVISAGVSSKDIPL